MSADESVSITAARESAAPSAELADIKLPGKVIWNRFACVKSFNVFALPAQDLQM